MPKQRFPTTCISCPMSNAPCPYPMQCAKNHKSGCGCVPARAAATLPHRKKGSARTRRTKEEEGKRGRDTKRMRKRGEEKEEEEDNGKLGGLLGQVWAILAGPGASCVSRGSCSRGLVEVPLGPLGVFLGASRACFWLHRRNPDALMHCRAMHALSRYSIYRIRSAPEHYCMNNVIDNT